MLKPKETAFSWYFYFVQERMEIFWRRKQGQSFLTEDPVLSQYKFTNVYRVLDRVSQYLIREVIYNERHSFGARDTLFRILVFKIFNKIETWTFLEEALEAPLSLSNFDVKYWSEILSYRIKETPIFSAAYMMTGSHQKYKAYASKHEKWLSMVDQEFVHAQFFDTLLEAQTLEKVFQHLTSRSFIGPFLAYQYAIDFNYSPYINFDENSFVKAGIGAKRGIKKCFEDFSKYSYEDCIKFTRDHFSQFQEQFGYTHFKALPNRRPTLIDLQNCFCETDKLLRVKMPELNLGNSRIKQHFRRSPEAINYFFPPKWGLNR